MSDSSDIITISLSLMNPPRRIPLELPSPAPSSTLHKLASDATTIPLGSIRLIFRGKMIPSIEEGNVIDTFKLENGCVVHCMGKPAAPSASTSAATSTSTSATSGNSTGSVVTPPSATAGGTAGSVATSTNINQSQKQPLTVALEGMKANHSNAEYTTALTTISKILSNIISNPNEEKYRKVKRSNPAFTKRLGRLTNSHDAMTSIGFVSTKSSEGNDEYSLVPNAEAWTKLTACKKIIDEMIQTNNQQNAPATNRNNFMGANQDLGFGGIPPTNNNMFPNNTNLGGGGSFPPPSQMMENMLSNPAALQSMLSNPMIQNMIMNDPRMRNNPMMQNSMRELMNNPSMVQQMTQMMSDPGIRSRMSSMMQQQQQQQQQGGTGFGSNPSGGGNSNAAPDMAAQMEMMRQFAASMANTNNQTTQQNSSGSTSNQPVNNSSSQQQPQQQNNGSNNDGERQMTEEEMIAEAIARSLREQ